MGKTATATQLSTKIPLSNPNNYRGGLSVILIARFKIAWFRRAFILR
jgi:hypothetical protein